MRRYVLTSHPRRRDTAPNDTLGDGVVPKLYRIEVRGLLSDHFASEFDGMSLTTTHGLTVLEGEIRDQSHLYGVIDRLHDFGLDLVSLKEAQ
jgi:hypothetical protein